MKTIIQFYSFSFLLFICLQTKINAQNSSTNLSLSPIFSNHMVLQQKNVNPIWGKAIPGANIEVNATWGESSKAKTDKHGNWLVKLNTPSYGGPYLIKIKSRNKQLELNDVMIGEVWLASGQSNMEWKMNQCSGCIDNQDEEIADANYPDIRMFNVPMDLSGEKFKYQKWEQAGNFGLNSQLKTSLEHPISIYAKDYDKNGSVDPILSCYDEGKNYPVFSKDDIQQQLTILKNRFVKYKEYADLTIDQVFTPEELEGSKVLYAKTFETSYMENLGNGQFKITALPIETQFSPIYGLTTGDFNQDGNLDVIMGGNFTASRVKFGHYDAIKGICLLGDGSGGFTYLDSSASGLMVSGEVRDIQKISLANGEEQLIFSRNNDTPVAYKFK